MPIIDGEKYACASCIKGHRVSGCQHIDRELRHINPKGRPVKQCEHCRGARKSKSHHAKCDCGDKKDKDGEAKADGNHCGCHHGAKCVCGQKKEPATLNLKLDTSSANLAKHTLNHNRPRLGTANSESTLTHFANGHHKPCHRLNNTAHTSGLPYKIPRSHASALQSASSTPLSSSSSQDQPGHVYGVTSGFAQRSVDNFFKVNNGNGVDSSLYQFGPAQRSADSLPLNLNQDVDLGRFDPSAASCFTYAPQQVGASISPERGSPSEPPTTSVSSVPQWVTWGNSVPASAGQQPGSGFDGYTASPVGELPTPDFSTAENDWAIPSAGLDPWSAVDLPLHPDKLSSSPYAQQAISHNGESTNGGVQNAVPGLTQSQSSGAQSEIGEPPTFGDIDVNNQQQPQPPPLPSLPWEDKNVRQLHGQGHFRVSSAGAHSHGLSMPPTSIPMSAPDNRPRSLDFDSLSQQQPPVSQAFANEQAGGNSAAGIASYDDPASYNSILGDNKMQSGSPTTLSTQSEASTSLLPAPVGFAGMENGPSPIAMSSSVGGSKSMAEDPLATSYDSASFSSMPTALDSIPAEFDYSALNSEFSWPNTL